jgi:anti-sigma B factor antagonist
VFTQEEQELVRTIPERVVTLTLEGEIGARELKQLSSALLDVARRGIRNVVLDFSDVHHVDYRCVKPLLARADLFRNVDGDVKLSSLSPYLHAIFRSAGAHDLFQYCNSPEEARAAFERM